MKLLATKLHRPSLPARWVQRPQLNQHLNEGLEQNRRITLVSAPAGFGKTTCVSAWMSTLDDWPIAWLSLDPADDEPGRFFSYLVAALQKVSEALGQELGRVLNSGQVPPGDVVSAILINDLVDFGDRLLLALDDFHVLQDQSILGVMQTLVTNLPLPVHLVLLTREDPPLPLGRLRANNELTEVRALDLRFSGQDTSRYLKEVMNLSLSEADVAVLEDKTEGWIAGLQLAAIALQSAVSATNHDRLSTFIDTLSGRNRFILNYLTEQVLSTQPRAVRRFLLQTSILDRLNGNLCDAVTGRSDSHELLQELFRANLFLIPLDDEGQWYRYHHLFADLLRGLQSTLSQKDIAELHQRASQWYAHVADPEVYLTEAMQHALTAKDYSVAVQLLERHSTDMIMQGHAKTVNGWVRTIPTAWMSHSPRTSLAFAWMHLLQGTYAEALPYLEHVEAAFDDPCLPQEESDSLRAEWLAIQTFGMNMEGRVAESVDLAAEALAIAPKTDHRLRALAYWGLATGYQATGAYERAIEAYQKAIEHGRSSGHLVAEMMSISGLAQLALERGQLQLSFDVASQAVDRAECSYVLSPISTVAYGALGHVYYHWNQLEPARRHFQRALELSTLGGYNSGQTGCHVLLSRALQLQGRLDDAIHELQRAVELARVDGPDYVRQEIVAQQVSTYLAQRQPGAAQAVLEAQGISFGNLASSSGFSLQGPISYSLGLMLNSVLRVVLHQARVGRDLAQVKPAITFSDHLLTSALSIQCMPVALETLLLRAQLHDVLGSTGSDPDASQADYRQALEMAEPEGFINVFHEQGQPVYAALGNLLRQEQLGGVQPAFVVGILDAFDSGSRGTAPPEQSSLGPPPTGSSITFAEPLTDRELEVLELISKGLKYRDIATRLFISLNTVRFHVKSIYGKLNVNNRVQAVTTARQLGLL